MSSTRAVNPWPAIGACVLLAFFEGLDIQSMGVAAPKVAPLFDIGPRAMGLILSASTIGLTVGAAIGGWLSDRWSRTSVLLASMTMLGLFSLASGLAIDRQTLLAARFLAGLGLGGVLPNLIAITSETAPARVKSTALALVYCGMPAGGAFAAWLAGATAPDDWNAVFVVGGIGPLIALPAILMLIPRYRVSDHVRAGTPALPPARVGNLFGPRAAATLQLWLAYFFTLLAVYLLLNWLPSMLIGRGMSKPEAAHAAILLNIGAVVGSLILGRLVDRGHLILALAAAYGGMLLMLGALIAARGSAVYWVAFGTGFFVIGGQLVLYAMAPMVYPSEVRGTGVGSAVAVGRAGSVLGPLLAGVVIAHGIRSDLVPAIAMPGLAIALPALLILAGRGRLREPTPA